jgi:hypothetical protein
LCVNYPLSDAIHHISPFNLYISQAYGQSGIPWKLHPLEARKTSLFAPHLAPLLKNKNSKAF